MTSYRRETSFAQRLLIVGTGCVAQGFLPLLLRHVDLRPGQITLLGPDVEGAGLAREYGVTFRRNALTPKNYGALLSERLSAGDCLLNLALGVGSLDLLAWCQAHAVLYIDTNLEPWSNSIHALHVARDKAMEGRRQGRCTAVIAHGANPGLVSHFLKQGICEIAAGIGLPMPATPARGWWASVASALGVRVVQIAERDSQVSNMPPRDGEFANTWSAQGLAGELCHPAELGWGTHESRTPSAANVVDKPGGRVVVFERPAGTCLARSWGAGSGAINGYVVGHHEAISICDLLTTLDCRTRPTVFYTYQPCPAARHSALELRQRGWRLQSRTRVMKAELNTGDNELGVLLLGIASGYWIGSRLGLSQARELAPNNNATSLQVAAGVLGGLVWAIENPWSGIVEAEDMEYRRVLAVASPYLGVFGGIATDWSPVGVRPRDAALRFDQFLVDATPPSGSLLGVWS